MISPRRSCSLNGFARSATHHDRKLQALALVNAHQPDGVFLRDRRDLRLGFGLALRLDEFQEAKQSLPLKLIKLSARDAETVRRSPAVVRRADANAAIRRNAFPPAPFQALRQATPAAPVSASAKTVREMLKFSPRVSCPRPAGLAWLRFSAVQKCPPATASRMSASSSSDKPTSGERNTAMHGTSCNGLSSNCSRLNKSAISCCRKIRRAR